MIRVTVEIGEGAVARRVAITAPSMVLELAHGRKPGGKCTA